MKKILLLLLLPCLGLAQQTREFSLVTYNSLRYSPTNLDDRHPHFRLILNDLQPDLLVLQELSGKNSALMFRDSVLNRDSVTYSMASFTNGHDLDVALYYKSQQFSFISHHNHPTQLRDIFEYRLLPTQGADTLRVFGVHLKASSGSTNQNRRAAEVAVLRLVTNQLPAGSNFIVCGDFNIYSSNEPAYQDLLDDTPGDDGHFVDAINISGTWNNANYALYHTQSPRTTQFNGGAHGGIDDRFDMILYSEALATAGGIDYLSGSMKTYGNDGLHYNKSIIDAPANTAVDSSIAHALHLASDHLPVEARFTYELKSGLSQSEQQPRSWGLRYHQGLPLMQNSLGIPLQIRIFSLGGQLLRDYESAEEHRFGLSRGSYLLEAHPKGKAERGYRWKLLH